MRQRDPKHDARLARLQSVPEATWLAHVAITDYRHPDFVASEVLSTLIRARFGQGTGQLSAAVNALNLRVIAQIGKHIYTHPVWRPLAESDSELVAEAVSYLWDKLFSDSQPVSNSEVRFAVYLANRVDDFMRSQLTFSSSMASSDDMNLQGDDGEEIRLIDTLVDPEGETPEEYATRQERHDRVFKMMMGLPKEERNAFYFREEMEFEWPKVADLLGCSVPTARKHYWNCVNKLKGEL